MKKIIGKNLILRPITYEDTDLIVKWRNNPEVRKNFIFKRTFTPEMHNNWMKDKVETGLVVQYIIVYKQKNYPVGSVYFRDIDKTHRSAEFGIFIGEDSIRGKGFGKEATKLFIDFGFTELNLHRIALRVIKNNDTARAVYSKVGFKEEGVFKDMVYLDGEFKDVIFMAALNGKE